MSRLLPLLLGTALLPAAVAAHADTITTDYVVFNYTTADSLLTTTQHQYNFSFTDGAPVIVLGVTNFSTPVTVYPGTGTTGTPTSGSFGYATTGEVQFSPFGGFMVAGASASPIKSTTFVYNPVFEEVAFFFQPGTYTVTNPAFDPVSFVPIVSASYTLSQGAPAIPPIFPVAPPPAMTAVTPEPSTFALLGTGLLGIGGALHRRVRMNV